MLQIRWFKVLNDLLSNKIRTLLIVLSIAVGLFAVGTIISARAILSTELARSYNRINPSSGTVRTAELFDENFIQSVRDMRGVAEVDARRTSDGRIQVGTAEEWHNLTLFTVEDYDAMTVNKVFPTSGAWPPPAQEILIERSALAVINAEVGDVITLEMPSGKERQLRITGLAHDMAQLPAQIDGTPYGYLSFETLEWLGEDFGYNELHIVAVNAEDKELARQVVNAVKDKAERIGMTIPLSMTAEPGQVPLDDILQAILLLMGALAILSLFLSAFLIINTVSALLAQQKRQIGIIKAVGGSTGQVLGMYSAMVIIYGILALLISIPLSVYGAQGLSNFLAAMFNFDLGSLDVTLDALIIQVVIGLVVPVVASLYPLLSSLKVSAAEAMSNYDLGLKTRVGLIDRLLSGANLWFARFVLLRPVLLSVRNTFRSKWRLMLTLLTLSLAGSIFISVFSVQSSIMATLDDMLSMWSFEIIATFERPYRVERIQHETLQIPGVKAVDVWTMLPTRRIRPDDTESGLIYMIAPRPDSEIMSPPAIVEGRYITPDDENAVVVTVDTLKEEPDLQLGDSIVLKIDGKERSFEIVGVALGVSTPMVYADFDYVSYATGDLDMASTALIATDQSSETHLKSILPILEEQYEAAGMRITTIHTTTSERAEAESTFAIITSLLLFMSILLALVGGLGLMGTMSINVLERTREIGVLRAIGASNQGVAQVFIREGIGIGVLSWGFGSLLAYPMSQGLAQAVGMALMGVPLSFAYSISGMWIWLVAVILLSAIASLIPARNASRLTVREVLAYE
jgi:putative ABC transport system permease protein